MTSRGAGPHFLHEAAGWTGAFTLAFGVDGRVLADAVRIAGDSPARRRGLLGRESLAPGEGLIVAPTWAIHTFGMRFPIDVVFVDSGGLVLRIAGSLAPSRVSGAWGAFAAIEVVAGLSEAVGLAPGARLVARRTPAKTAGDRTD